VLVVEDDPSLALMYRTSLSLSGFSVLIARDGLSALQVMEREHPDAAILDLMLPVLDGWTVLREFESLPASARIPVVVVTSADPGTASAYASAIIRKPCDPDYVVTTIRRHLASAQGAAF
jgi:DNA-binding response OmpR family regulator